MLGKLQGKFYPFFFIKQTIGLSTNFVPKPPPKKILCEEELWNWRPKETLSCPLLLFLLWVEEAL